MILREVKLEKVLGVTSPLPEGTLPEFAFAGKSNVGKSSLINLLMNRKSLARVSGKPGKTQTINYYRINNDCYFVDLPGYGFARANVEIKAEWGKMVERYLHNSTCLKSVFLLIDIRHAPSENDKMMYEWIVSQGFEPVIIGTKYDKLKRSEQKSAVLRLRKELKLPEDALLFPVSAVSREGREELMAYIDGRMEG